MRPSVPATVPAKTDPSSSGWHRCHSWAGEAEELPGASRAVAAYPKRMMPIQTKPCDRDTDGNVISVGLVFRIASAPDKAQRRRRAARGCGLRVAASRSLHRLVDAFSVSFPSAVFGTSSVSKKPGVLVVDD